MALRFRTFLIALWAFVMLAGIPWGIVVAMESGGLQRGLRCLWHQRHLYTLFIGLKKGLGGFWDVHKLFPFFRNYFPSFQLDAAMSVPNPRLIYLVFALGMLAWALYRWCTKPSPRTCLWSFICGWGLCGPVGIYIVSFYNSCAWLF